MILEKIPKFPLKAFKNLRAQQIRRRGRLANLKVLDADIEDLRGAGLPE